MFLLEPVEQEQRDDSRKVCWRDIRGNVKHLQYENAASRWDQIVQLHMHTVHYITPIYRGRSKKILQSQLWQ